MNFESEKNSKQNEIDEIRLDYEELRLEIQEEELKVKKRKDTKTN